VGEFEGGDEAGLLVETTNVAGAIDNLIFSLGFCLS